MHLLDLVTQAGGDKLFIICKNMWEQAIDTLVGNNARGPVTAYAATIRPFEDLRRDMTRDIALLTGATFITDVAGMSPLGLTVDDLGQADRIVATEEYVSIVGGGGDAQAVQAHSDSLRSRMRQVAERTEQEQLRERIGRLQGGVGELRVGAYTEKERNALVERAAHAVKVVQMGLEGGVVPGGGPLIWRRSRRWRRLQRDIRRRRWLCGRSPARWRSRRARSRPMRDAYGPLVLEACRERGPGYAYEVGQGCVRNMLEAGIVDPTLIAKAALQQAASGAAMLISAEALVLQRTPPQSYQP